MRDNDGAYGHVFTSRVRAMGIRDEALRLNLMPGGFAFFERRISVLRKYDQEKA